MLFLLSALLLIRSGISEKAGDRCLEQYTNTWGVCASARQCVSARQDYQNNGIRPTFCNYDRDNPLICCRDGVSILQTEHTPPKTEMNTDTRRVSERKCEEYSRSVVESVVYIPLIPDPEQMTISAPRCDYTGIELIIGGENANQGEFPHMAAVGWVDIDEKYVFQCGGSLISSRVVLTAGHCILNPRMQNPEPTIVRLGDQNLDPTVKDGANPVDVPIKIIHKHPEYAPPSKYNDIALLELVTDVDFSSDIRPACLWSKNTYNGLTKALAIGWGVTDPRTRHTSKELKKVSLSILDNAYCERLLSDHSRNWARGFISSQLCAGELRGGKDTCQGDSGSPLQIASRDNKCIFHVIGITSFGRSCAVEGKPAIYTRVSSYLDWIEAVVWPGE